MGQSFDDKFQNFRNETNEKLFLSVQESLKSNYEARPDFVKLLEMNLTISSNEKLKFCILIEDVVEILDDVEAKKLRRHKEENPSLKMRCRKSFKWLLNSLCGCIHCMLNRLREHICNEKFLYTLLLSLLFLSFETLSLGFNANYWYSLPNVVYCIENFPDVYKSLKGILIVDICNVISSAGIIFLTFVHDNVGILIFIFKCNCYLTRVILGIAFLAGNNCYLKDLLDFMENKEEYKILYQTLLLAWNYDIFYSIWAFLCFLLCAVALYIYFLKKAFTMWVAKQKGKSQSER